MAGVWVGRRDGWRWHLAAFCPAWVRIVEYGAEFIFLRFVTKIVSKMFIINLSICMCLRLSPGIKRHSFVVKKLLSFEENSIGRTELLNITIRLKLGISAILGF